MVSFNQLLGHRLDYKDTTTLNQSGPENKDNEGETHTPEIFKTGSSWSDRIYCHTQNIKDTLCFYH